MPNEYKLLDKSSNYDKETVKELALAINELNLIEQRRKFLLEIITENKNLSKFVWTDQNGGSAAICDLEASHLENIMKMYTRNGEGIPKEIIAEARGRNMTVPNTTLRLAQSIDMDDLDDEDDDFND